jgi:hypothetical protein
MPNYDSSSLLLAIRIDTILARNPLVKKIDREYQKMMQKPALLCILLLGLLACQPQTQPGPHPFEADIEIFEQADRESFPPSAAILFIGSSSIRGWETLKEDMAPFPVINRGFGGSQAHHVLYYMDRIVFPYQPRAIVFYEGDNDIAAGKHPQQFIDECRIFADRVQHHLPGTPIFFLSVKPSVSRTLYEEARREANKLLQELAAGDDRLHYVDISTDMFDASGRIRDDIFLDDQLHLNAKGYELWANIIRKELFSFFNLSQSDELF